MHDAANQASAAARILIVEDSLTQAKLLEQTLAAHGYEVCVARNGGQALEKIMACRPDLVISDIVMPEMDGFELCRRVRGIEGVKGTPIILLTHLNDPADVLRSLEAGATYFVSKPYSEKLLISRIEAVLQGNGACLEREADSEAAIRYQDKSYLIHATRAQTVELLLSTYELAAEKNQELLAAKQSLKELNRELEQRVKDRTEALVQETAERLQAMEELRKKDEVLMLQSRQAAMGEMINNIAHQWRQPLSILGLLAQNLRSATRDGEFSSEYVEENVKHTLETIQHMSQTIDDFMHFFRPDKEKVHFRMVNIVEKSIALLHGALKEQRVKTAVTSACDAIVNGYPNEFSQALLNIMINAKDAFAAQNVINPTIAIEIGMEGDRCAVTITDNAGGIPEEIIGRIFDPYFSTKGPDKGTGVGLYMTKEIIEKSMGGSLSARNTGSGAQFRIVV